MTAIQAARAAALLRREPGIEVRLEAGPYGSFQVLVGDTVIVDAGAMAFLGVLPSLTEIRSSVTAWRDRERLGVAQD